MAASGQRRPCKVDGIAAVGEDVAHAARLARGRFEAIRPHTRNPYYKVRRKATKSARSCVVKPMPKRSL
jgi:hypothetical protein